ncbi:hypothetical protein ACR79M_16860 [Sphingobacterium spiritivorum]|uniref:hypothetical protein n=1 Tax=Sphingobacterium spiritivorum TaxID=258 RepID=UPI003DA5CDC3
MSTWGKLNTLQKSVSGENFGIKADYNGRIGTDNTNAFQKAVDYCSKHHATLLLPKGRILVNSYGKTAADKAHGNIIQLKSNVSILGNNTEIIIGEFFDDKFFIVFSGFNHVDPYYFSNLDNISLKNFTIDFNANRSKMKSAYHLRRGIEFGHVTNATANTLVMKNGDLTCAIATGHGDRNHSKNIIIKHNKFIDLIQTEKNIDHSTIYLNSTDGIVESNIFQNNSLQGKLIACAVELHNSSNIFSNNIVKGYTRMSYLAAIGTENKNISNLTVSGNNAEITNAAVYLWVENDTRMSQIQIKSNTIQCSHIKGYPMLYNGTQGIICDAKADKPEAITDIIVQNNKIHIKYTAFKGRAVKYNTRFIFRDINNSCIGCVDGTRY